MQSLSENMLCLGIETSCDETALALVQNGQLIDQVLASQTDLHGLFGGVVPELASREHYRFIGPLADELLSRNKFDFKQISGIAIARGPGLLGSLLVGSAFAKGLALSLQIPLIGVNHLHAHLLVNGLDRTLTYPALGLLVSGGHTQIYKINAPDQFEQLGRTLDDAAGEAFDKIGQFLGFSYPAGKEIDRLAAMGSPVSGILPLPFIHTDKLDFSFSGLKTAAIQYIKNHPELRVAETGKIPSQLNDFCATLNQVIADSCILKLSRALALHEDIKAVWLAGGVAANSALRQAAQKLAKEHGLTFLAPPKNLCTDNGAMIAYAGYLLLKLGHYHDLAYETYPRGKKIPQDWIR